MSMKLQKFLNILEDFESNYLLKHDSDNITAKTEVKLSNHLKQPNFIFKSQMH